MILPHAHARFLAAVAFGVSCRPQTEPQRVDVAPPPPASASAAASASATATATASASASAAPSASASPITKLVCASPSKRERRCIAQKTVPQHGMIAPAPGYNGWDANGCFPASEMVDSCSGVSDARGPFFQNKQCCFEVCQGLPPPCGLALVVDGTTRVASLRKGTNADEALMEHASIAAFARLSLELMALGAPSELVRRAHQAALDEIEHARFFFEQAGAEPGPLPLDGLALRDRRTLAREIGRDSCVGETVAAIDLARRGLRKMSEEELEHAALGWSILAWLGEDVPIEVNRYDVPSEVLDEARALVRASAAAVAAASTERAV